MKLFQFRNWPMFNKILFIGIVISLLFVASTLFLVVPKTEHFLREEKETNLTNLIQVGESVLKREVRKWKTGESTLQEAQERAMEAIRALNYDGDNYFWINDTQHVMLMHPQSPELEGQKMGEVQDPDGVYIFREMVNTATSKGSGFVNYMWPKPGEVKPVPKISYVVYQKDWNWVLGTGIYVADLHAKTNALKAIVIGILAVCGVIAFGLSVWVAFIIVAPIKHGVEFAKNVAAGDLSKLVDCDREDEFGLLIKELNKMVASLRKLFTETSEGVVMLNQSSNEIMAISQQIGASVQQTTAKASVVTGKAQGMDRSMGGISQSSEDTLGKINSIVSAVEEMNVTFNEISRNTENARLITEKAVEQGNRASQQVDTLGSAAESISKVTEVISAISAQTNLLALNATIEAASAGEAGKGFAVVANEIKELARQTANATKEISQNVERIQQTTSMTVVDIKDISNIIDEVNTYVSSIAGAIEEQAAVTSEIAFSVSQASDNLGEVNQQVVRSSGLSNSVVADMEEVHKASKEVLSGTRGSIHAIENLTQLAAALEKQVRLFKLA